MIEGAGIGGGVRRRALEIFDRIARVEARLHGVSVEEVAFHEVGAIDSIVDIVAAAAALDWLAPSRVTSRVVPLGHGSIVTAHGVLPLPGPATLALLLGVPVEDGGAAAELTTPTGAAILAATASSYGVMPAMRVVATGWGAGDRELPDRPNLLRVVAGHPLEESDAASDHSTEEPSPGGDRCVVLEANVDDMTPELAGLLVGDLLAAGARDAWLVAALMKKGRPGWVVSALVDPAQRERVEAALFAGSTTIGVRRHVVDRTVLPRRFVDVETPFGVVSVKVSGHGGADDTVAPEMEACRRLADAARVPLKRVYAEAIAAFYRR